MDGFVALLGASWALLGPLLAALGWLLVPLGRFLGASWALLGRSWASLGWSEAPFGCILPPKDVPGLDFGGFGDVLGWVWEGFGGIFHVLRTDRRTRGEEAKALVNAKAILLHT